MRSLPIMTTSSHRSDHDEWSFLALGTEALERGQLAEAEICFRKAVAYGYDRPEPWYWLGRLKERQGDPQSAAHCYFLACEAAHYQPALESLKRLGYDEEGESRAK